MPHSNPAQPLDIHTLYHDHHGWLKGWLLSRVGCTESAADMTHDTFLKLMNKQRANRDFVVSYPRSYLRIVANNLMVDLFRRWKVEEAYLEALAQRPEPVTLSAEEREIVLETLQALDKMLDALPTQMRKAFLMSRMDGLTYAQIAERLQVSERTVKRYMQQAYMQCLALML